MHWLVAGHVYVVPSEDWGSMTSEEFGAKVMAPGSRGIVRVPSEGTLKELLEFVEVY